MKKITPGVEYDVRAYRSALGKFLTGVAVVCATDGKGHPRGITANSFSSVSLDPPLLLVCIAKTSSSYEVFSTCDSFTVSILQEEQKGVSTTFAMKTPDKFGLVDTFTAVTGTPIVARSLGWFDCRPFDRVDAGDHMILVGQVEAYDAIDGPPLGYWGGGYVTLGLEADAVCLQGGSSTHVGCIVDWNGRVLFTRSPQNGWLLPSAPLSGSSRNHHERISRLMESLKIKAEATFLYSVFEVPDTGRSHIFYRAEVNQAAADQLPTSGNCRFFGPAELPWDELPNQPTRAMLRRYFRERTLARFGIYSDAGMDGSVASIESRPTPWRADEG